MAWHWRDLSVGLYVPLLEFNHIVDRPEARKQLEQTNPGLVAARDKGRNGAPARESESRASAKTSLTTNAG